MSKYLEEGATYKIQIPKDFAFKEGDITRLDGFSYEQQLQYWKNKQIRLTQHGCLGIEFTKGTILDENGKFLAGPSALLDRPLLAGANVYIYRSWIGELVKHCHQVEHYIKSQGKEGYTSPFDGETR